MTDTRLRNFTFVLLDRFTLLGFAGAVETLRLANRIAGHAAYGWRVVSENGAPVVSSTGIALPVDGPLPDLTRGDTAMLCGGLDVGQTATKPLLNWLRREARRGVNLGGLCTAAHVLARAGLLDGKRATIHWENQDSFAEDFPEIDLSQSVFVIDGPRLTCAGGSASVDLMLALIARDLGEDVAGAVADQQIYSSIRTDRDRQRMSVPTRLGVRHPKLAEVVQQMETHIEDPISPARLAADVGLSTRQLERLFRRYLNRSPKRYYMDMRLGRARNLLMQTDMSVINVALACGFTSPSHFSKCYRSQYGATPYRERGTRPAS